MGAGTGDRAGPVGLRCGIGFGIHPGFLPAAAAQGKRLRARECQIGAAGRRTR